MPNYKSDRELIECKDEIEDLAIQLTDMLEAMLYFAGVDKSKIEEATEAYIDALDEVFEDDEGEMGLDEVIEVVEYLKSNRSGLFK